MHLKFDGDASDSSENGIHGVVHGATLTDDRLGNRDSAYAFDGDWDYIEAGTVSDFNCIHNGADFTISVWVKHDTTDGSSGILGNTIGGDRRGFLLGVNGRNVSFSVGRTTPYPVMGKNWENVFAEGLNWNHIAIKYNSIVGQYNVYVNGDNVNEPVSPINPHQDGDAFYTLKIGTSKIVPSYGWATADIDDLQVYSRALSDAEIQEIYQPSTDSDNDGLPDVYEQSICTNPLDADTDNDGILDGMGDEDQDGVLGLADDETHPCFADTDNDGILDGTKSGLTADDIGPDTDPVVFIPDANPTTTTNPLLTDTDGDGIPDGDEDFNHNGLVDEGEGDPNKKQAVALPFIPLLLFGD
ncbi:hypothetical protein DSCA_53000 [Desulfosarcina alkanivorans]|uniref:LamG-like jellyroll fold domain-containing protein n=1 Tax=Desulfosarcina alkanivorans TaxID=571177 RepID=A0A5K7YSU0_9BACT|nr:LamG domain-containing protein [Desulfosarcina alkanivorans]BBO71370.1 hypothetical protein DSCA_53000 [Desulfosarcina alkanivorans]